MLRRKGAASPLGPDQQAAFHSSAAASAGPPHASAPTPLLPACLCCACCRCPEAPVMFLSGGGVYVHADPRRTSIAGAVQFAAGAQLQGIILHTRALQEELHMVQAARSRGLRVRAGRRRRSNCNSICCCCPMRLCSRVSGGCCLALPRWSGCSLARLPPFIVLPALARPADHDLWPLQQRPRLGAPPAPAGGAGCDCGRCGGRGRRPVGTARLSTTFTQQQTTSQQTAAAAFCMRLVPTATPPCPPPQFNDKLDCLLSSPACSSAPFTLLSADLHVQPAAGILPWCLSVCFLFAPPLLSPLLHVASLCVNPAAIPALPK